MAQVHFSDCFCHPVRFSDVVLGGATVCDSAVSAIAGADVAKDHEGGGAVLPTFTDVRTVRFLTHRMKVELAHQALEPHVVGAHGRFDLQPRRFAFRERLGAVTPHDLIKSIWHLLGPTGGENPSSLGNLHQKRSGRNCDRSWLSGDSVTRSAIKSPVRGAISTPLREWPQAYRIDGFFGSGPRIGSIPAVTERNPAHASTPHTYPREGQISS